MLDVNRRQVDVRLALPAIGGVVRGNRLGVPLRRYEACGLAAAGYLRVPYCVCCGELRRYLGGRAALCSPREWWGWYQEVEIWGSPSRIRWEHVEPHGKGRRAEGWDCSWR